VKVRFWGTRGSLPSPGPDTVRYGGNTSCVEVRSAPGAVVVLDAGTGIRALGAALSGDDPSGHEPARVDILLTHLHMDHIQGLGFFAPLFRPGLDVHIWGPASTTLDLRARLTRYLSPPLFPVRLRDLPCSLALHDVPLDTFELPGVRVSAALVCHPGPTVGYRLEDAGGSLAYLPDHEPALGVERFPDRSRWTSGFGLAAGVDVLVHDSQFTPGEYAQRVGWGHSSLEQAIAFAALAGVGQLVAFHHDPGHDDTVLDRLFATESAKGDGSVPLTPAREGGQLDVGTRSSVAS